MLTCGSLIMLLIQSDMFKALWFMIYPIVVFARGPVRSESIFCKVNGFFVAVGIEASGTTYTLAYSCVPRLSGYRYRCAHDCHSLRSVYLRTESHIRRRGSLPISAPGVLDLVLLSNHHGFNSLRQRYQCICVTGHLLLSSSTAILVQSCIELGPSIYYFPFHSGYLRIYIFLCPVQISQI